MTADERKVAFLVDQQLPARLAAHLKDLGHDARHIKQYPGGTTMPDTQIAAIADLERRTVVSKDDDFRLLHLTRRRPASPPGDLREHRDG